MKKSVVLSLTVLSSLLAIQITKADVLADWTFESSGLGSSSPSFAPGANTATTNFFAELGTQAGTATAVGLHSTAATYTSPAGNGSAKSLSANNWSVGDYFQFSLNTTGYQGITLSYDQTGSATGPSKFFLEYSTDGTSFTTFGNTNSLLVNAAPNFTWNTTTTTNGYNFAYDLSSVNVLTNSSLVVFRVVDASTASLNGGTVATTGTDRIDNFIVNGTAFAVPEPSIVALASMGGMACLVALRRKR
jgi:hypothetical protein